MIVNEEGLIHKLPFNSAASIIADRPICGRAIVKEGGEE